MFRVTFAAAAVALLLAGGAAAQDVPVDLSTGPMVMADGYHGWAGDNLGSRLFGATIFSSGRADAQVIGTITDIVVNESGDIAAVIVGVGGLLRIGEKNVAVDYFDLQWVRADDGSRRYVLPTTAESLLAAPAFVWDNDPPGTLDSADLPEALSSDDVAGSTPTAAYDPFAHATLTAAQLLGAAVYGPTDEQIGTIADFVLGGADRPVEAVVVEAGGFLGLGSKKVALSVDDLVFSFDGGGKGYFVTVLSRQELESRPVFSRDAWAAQRG